MSFPFYKQPDQMDCGLSCLQMIVKHYGHIFKLQNLRKLREINREGVSLLGISDATEKISCRSLCVKLNPDQLNESEYYKIDRQHEWRQPAEVTATPTMLLNGYRLPELYQLPGFKIHA
jgi:ABC-type bacteriocin/lantibiotic exporter with double-glycine peptidase domain